MDGADHCVWHADPEAIPKSADRLQETRAPSEIRQWTSVNIYVAPLAEMVLTESLDGADLSTTQLDDEISFEQVTLRDADFSNACLFRAKFSDAHLGEANLSGANLHGAEFSHANLKGADLTDANLEGARLPGAYLAGTYLSNASLLRADLSVAYLVGADLTDAMLGQADLSEATLKQAELSDAYLGGADLQEANLAEANLTDAYLEGTDLTDANLEGANLTDAYLEGTDLTDANLEGANLTDANLKNTTFHNANLEEAVLSRATLSGADLRGARIHGSILGDVRIDANTEFLGPPVRDGVRSSHTCAAIFSKPCCVYDPNYSGGGDETNVDEAKSVYQALEELAGRAAQTRLQSQCFVRRQDTQKNTYKTSLLNGPQEDSDTDTWEVSDNGTETTDSKSVIRSRLHSLEVRTIAGLRYARAKTARMTLLYGESPWRIIVWSGGFVVAMALVYPLNEWLKPVGEEPITYSRVAEDPTLLLESLYFSTLTFTTLGMGDYEPLGWGLALATLNTIFGAILIALLVFVLGRRAAR